MKNKIKRFAIKHLRFLDIILLIWSVEMAIDKNYNIILEMFIFRCILEIIITIYEKWINNRKDLNENEKDWLRIGKN